MFSNRQNPVFCINKYFPAKPVTFTDMTEEYDEVEHIHNILIVQLLTLISIVLDIRF